MLLREMLQMRSTEEAGMPKTSFEAPTYIAPPLRYLHTDRLTHHDIPTSLLLPLPRRFPQ